MEEAKAAVAKFTGRTGHDTEVEEHLRPGVTSETIKPHRHEETTEAIDREIHRHHHHTTVQPISHQEVLPETHTHHQHDIEKREFMHGSPEETQKRLDVEHAPFKNHSITHKVHHTQAAAPAVTGEHVHHHVHEHVQPVVYKETVQPEVVHHTKPIHEVHHHHAEHHGMSALPMKTLDEFKSAGGIFTGGKNSSHEKYEGEPRKYNDKLSTTLEKLGLGEHGHQSHHGAEAAGAGAAGATGVAAAEHHHDETAGTSGQHDTTGTRETGTTAAGAGSTNQSGFSNPTTGISGTDSSLAGTDIRHGATGTSGTSSTGRSGLIDHRGAPQEAAGDSLGTTGAPTSQGPVHSSGFANAVDPRVDSDPKGQSMGKSSYPADTAHQHADTTGKTGMSGVTGDEQKISHGQPTTDSAGYSLGTTGAPTSQGPLHSSKFANALDPRVQSDPLGQSMGKSSYPADATGEYASTTAAHRESHEAEHEVGYEPHTRQGPSTYSNYNVTADQTGVDESPTSGTTTTKKPSLKDRLNPFKDTSSK